jgi:hypothetical protein
MIHLSAALFCPWYFKLTLYQPFEPELPATQWPIILGEFTVVPFLEADELPHCE